MLWTHRLERYRVGEGMNESRVMREKYHIRAETLTLGIKRLPAPCLRQKRLSSTHPLITLFHILTTVVTRAPLINCP